MKKETARIVQRVLNVVGVVTMIISLNSILNNYSQLYELAATGSSPYGRSMSDFPSSLISYVLALAAGILVSELGQWIYKRSDRSTSGKDAV